MKCTNNFYLYLLISLQLITLPLRADVRPDDDDDFGFFDEQIIALNQHQLHRASPAVTTAFIEGFVDLVTLLGSGSLYTRTNPLTYRNIDASDIFWNNSTHLPLKNVDFFATQISSGNYFKEEQHLKNYIDLEQKNLITVLDELQATLDGDNITFPNLVPVLELFHTVKVQERKVGFMFSYYNSSQYQEYFWSIRAPFMYQERNFYLTPAEQDAIEQEPLFQGSQIDFIAFAKEHLISDKIGIGDTKITIHKCTQNKSDHSFKIGFEVTLPTAFAFKNGILGNYFDKKKAAWTIDLHKDIIEPIAEAQDNADKKDLLYAQVVTYGTAFGQAVLDRLSTLLLEKNLGNERHVALGLSTITKYNFTDTITLISYLLVEQQLPGYERRFIKKFADVGSLETIVANIEAINNLPDGAEKDASSAAELAKINTKLEEYFFPTAYKLVILPGISLTANTTISLVRPRMTYFFSSDMWYQKKDTFLSVGTDDSTKKSLDISGARKSDSYQTRMCVGIQSTLKEDQKWYYGCKVSFPMMNVGIGGETSISIFATYIF